MKLEIFASRDRVETSTYSLKLQVFLDFGFFHENSRTLGEVLPKFSIFQKTLKIFGALQTFCLSLYTNLLFELQVKSTTSQVYCKPSQAQLQAKSSQVQAPRDIASSAAELLRLKFKYSEAALSQVTWSSAAVLLHRKCILTAPTRHLISDSTSSAHLKSSFVIIFGLSSTSI